MGFCPFLSLKINALSNSIIDQGGVEYERDNNGEYRAPSSNTISDNAPTVMAGVLPRRDVEVEKLIDAAGGQYLPDGLGAYRDGADKTPAENGVEITSAETAIGSFGFFPCPEDVSCKLWDGENDICGLLDANGSSSGGGPPKASLLLNEYMGGEDLDGNGAIYGKHFFITASERPPMLATMPEAGEEWSWQEYLDSL